MDSPTSVERYSLFSASIQNLNMLDTVSPIVVWLSDQNYGGVPSMLSRTVSAAASPYVRMTAATRWISGAFMLFLFAASAVAQSTAGRILGTVSDQSGAAVGGATVVVT